MTDRNTDRRPSIVEGALVRCSPSQVQAFALCPRKWWYDKVAKFPRKPPSKGQMVGTEKHAEIEHWLTTGEDVRSALARESDDYLKHIIDRAPHKGGDLLVEIALSNPTLFTYGGVEIVGYADLVVPPLDDGIVEIIDHKFRKAIRPPGIDPTTGARIGGYGATREKLYDDVQGITYGAWALLRWPNANAVRVAHHEHQTSGARCARRVDVDIPVDHVKKRWGEICHTIDVEMRRLTGVSDPAHVPHKAEAACNAYGGCDFKAVCPDSPVAAFTAKLLTHEEKKPMGLLDSIKNKNATAPAAPPPAEEKKIGTTTVVYEDGTIPASEAVDGGTYLLSDGRKAKVSAKTPANVFMMDENNAAVALSLTDRLKPYVEPKPVATGVLPPDAPKSDPANAPQAARDVTAEETAETTDREPAKEEKPRRGPGRPRKETAPVEEASVSSNPLILLVNTSVRGGVVRDGDKLVADLAAKVAKAAGVDDVRFVDKSNPLAYAAWRGAIARAALEATNEHYGFVQFTSSELAEPVIEALAPKAAMVVRGGVR